MPFWMSAQKKKQNNQATMSTLKTKDLSKIGYTNDQARSLVINIISKHYKHHSKEELIALLTDIKAHPENHIKDEVTGKIAATFMDIEEGRPFKVFSLLSQPGSLKIVGGREIEFRPDGRWKERWPCPLRFREH